LDFGVETLTFQYGVDSDKCSERLGSSHFKVQSPCNPLMGDYTLIFNMIDKGDILSIRRKMSLRRPKSMRKVDGLNLIFIDFYVLALKPRLNSTANSLQLSENITHFVFCRIYAGVISKET
jgi:hypothetical protein